ncbi:MAG: DUF4386 domain-containing protein [Flavisolibacter sp.]
MKDKRLSAIARLAGTSYLLSTVIVVYANLGVVKKLVVFNNMTETTRNITGQESLFRFTMVLNLFYCIGTIINLAAIYALLKPVSNTLSLVAASLKLVMPLTWIFITVNSFVVLRLINVPVYSQVFNQDQFNSLVRLNLSGSGIYYIGLLFWSLASTVYSLLFFRSNYIPKLLAIFGMIASSWCFVCTVAYMIYSSFSNAVNPWWFDSPMVIFEIVVSIWLLFGIPQRQRGPS